MKTNRKINIPKALIYVLCLIVATGVSHGRSNSILVDKDNLDKSLQLSIEQYYDAESRGEWKAMYLMRRSAFREIVPFHTFENIMERSHRGWSLEKAEILEAQIAKDQFSGRTVRRVLILFVDKISDRDAIHQELPEALVETGVTTGLEMKVWTIWIQGPATWVCIDCGMRLHVPLNGRMVYD